jgi:hypothetical protein
VFVPGIARAQDSNAALVRLLQVLRDRGSITADEYEELRRVALKADSEPVPANAGGDAPKTTVNVPGDAPASAPANLPLDVRLAAQDLALSTLAARVTEQRAALDAVQATAQQAATDVVRQTLAPKWYERLGLRGYTQFRGTEVFTGGTIPLEVPADRSVNKSESLMIRRGRFIYSGDATDHLALYAQADFNASSGAADFSLQMRDLYADVALDDAKTFRFRLGQSKVPFGFVNLQSSQNRAPIERPDPLNSAVEGERDLGAYMMWAPARTRQLFRDLVNRGLKGSGDYGVIAVGAFSGQGLNRSDQNGSLHWLARASYPFAVGKKQMAEFGVQAYSGDYVVSTQAIDVNGASVTPSRPAGGQTDRRVAFTAVLYPQPFGFDAEWTVGTSPELAPDFRSIGTASLHGGYFQLHYRRTGKYGAWLPFTRWQYYDGARKFARNAPRTRVNEIDAGLEVARWTEVEVTAMYTRTLERVRTSAFPYAPAQDRNRFALQVQWNY